MQKFSRKELQEYKDVMIRKRAHWVVAEHYRNILQSAEYGSNAYLVSLNTENKTTCLPMGVNPLPEPTTEDILSAFKEIFPDCSVTYNESWVDQPPMRNQQTRVLKKSILIDWS